MDSETDGDLKIVLTIIIMSSAAMLLQTTSRKRRWWIKPWLVNKDQNLRISEEFLRCGDEKSYKNFLRMDEKTFNKLLNLVQTKISKTDTSFRKCIKAKDKLLITLRYLATGESYKSLMYNFRVHDSTISLFIPEVCQAIYDTLKDTYLHVPSSTGEWLEIARDFEEKWNLPNVLGSLDGKHIVIQNPTSEGSSYHNYKGTHSIVLLALVDANYKFTYVNIGTNGRISDGGVYRESDLFSAVENNKLNFPEDRPLPFRTKSVPFIIAADAAFPLSTHILKPFPFRQMNKEQRIFNYRLSRVRRVVENVFGILANRFRILLTTIPLRPEKAEIIVKACVALHNFLREEIKSSYISENLQEDLDRRYRFVYGLSRQGGNRSKAEAIATREEFMQYVNGPGAVSWQEFMI